MKNKKKTPNKKRIIARIIALGAMLGVIIALAIPCFALDPPSPPSLVVPNVNYSDVYYAFASTVPDTQHDVLRKFRDAYGYEGFFNYSYFNGGALKTTLSLPIGFITDSTIRFYTPSDGFRFVVGVNGYFMNILEAPQPEALEMYADLTVDIEGERATLSVNFTDNTHYYLKLEYVGALYYSSFYGYSVSLELVSARTFWTSVTDFENNVVEIGVLAHTAGHFGTGDQSTSLLSSLVDEYVPTSSSLASSHNPHEFMLGYSYAFINGYTSGFNNGAEQAESYYYYEGYNEGYDDGEGSTGAYQTGYDTGYDKGYNYGLIDSDAYDEGFDDAVRQISDGDFGRNLLGGLFKAPLEALNSFTLIETPDGVRITLGGLFSAVVALTVLLSFIKIFGGTK